MPDYTNPWDSSLPDGTTTPAAETDTQMQQIRIGMHERMDDLVEDWLDDPVVFPQFGSGVQFVKRYSYNTVGPVVNNASLVKSSLVISFQGVTDAVGDIYVDFNNFPEIYNVTDINVQTKVVGPFYDLTVNDFVFGFFVSADAILRKVRWNIRKADGGNVFNHAINGDILLFFNTVPT